MRRLPLIRSIVATLFGLSIAAVAGAIVAPGMAVAANPCCQVAIDSLPSQFHAGAAGENFHVVVKNTSQNSIGGVTVTLAFKAAGLNRNQVHLQYQRNGGWRGVGTRNQNGTIVATSSPNSDFFRHNSISPGQTVTFTYRLSFGTKAPTSSLAVWLSVAPSGHPGQAAQNGPYRSSIVGEGANSNPTPTPTPTPTDTPTDSATATPTDPATTDDSQDAGAIAGPTTIGGDGGGSGGGGMTWLAYTIGALLLLAGVGVIGTLLWRRGPQPVETEWAENEYGQSAYPAAPAPDYPPTTAFSPPASAPVAPPAAAYPAHTMPMQATPTGYDKPGRHSAPGSAYPAPQDPYADETMIDPR